MRRIVVKIGSSSLTDEAGRIEQRRLWAIARAVRELDAQVAVVSSGAVAAGCGLLGRPRPRTLPEKQAFAAVGQAALMQDWARAFAPSPVAQFLLSAGDIHNRRRFVRAKHALEATFKAGAVPIINENDTVATEELRLGDNDTLSAWVAYLAEAETLLLLTDVDGLYTANPRSDPQATRIRVVEDVDAVAHLAQGAGSARGTGGMHTKLRAARIAADAGIETVILGGGGLGLEAWARGADVGTRILARSGAARRGWLRHQPVAGTVRIDAGAVAALRSGRSLLPSGVTAVEGHFGFGDMVSLEGPDGPVAQGLSNYDAAELRLIAGAQTSEIETRLGHKDYDEVVHRNQLVLL
ncbi:glutamate 5-kinase [Deinobacterium chartae]|uniref:Glutamate 5-kinase n=1 Tax=Deinobacterium chartae TaxID=521158 RepID=A0A841HZV4_9DEIO|nr:glutamate 5-kinase [Deinobacterium chartae]MBB6098396.1 glutamate 5-kinase [Deinobacterium chartae]